MLMAGVNTRQSSQPYNVPPPVGGLNGRDPLANMDQRDAYLLDNAFPDTAAVESRRGCEKHTDTALAGPVQTLETYAGADGDVMLAWAADKIYDVSVATPSELKSGMNSAVAVNTMFSNAADNAQHLISVTGADTPMEFDGSSFTDLAITGTGLTSTNLSYVFTFKEQLYFAENEKLGFWFLPTGAIQGTASYFDLAQVSSLGGYLMAIASFSEGGETPQDYIVFITSKGECIVYSGYDPSNANTFGLVGRYFTASPISRRCAFNYNSELLILTREGALPFSAIRMGGDGKARGVAGSEYQAITSKLGRFLLDFTRDNADNIGWQIMHYSRSGWLVVNVPVTTSISGDYYHYVMNTATNAWCRFTNWNGMCFTVYNDRLYFGRYDGHVLLADEGRTDDTLTDATAPILWDIKSAYNYFADDRGSGPTVKHFQWANLIVACDGTPPLSGKFNVNFDEEQPEYVATLAESSGAAWDTSDWDTAEWGNTEDTQRFIITLNKGGFVGALWLRASLDGLTLKWYSTQYVIEPTRNLLI